MTPVVLDDGLPILVSGDGDRIGSGPWSRWLASAIVPDEGSGRAGRGRDLARSGAVHTVTIAPGSITARVIGSSGTEYDVTVAAATLAPRAWADAAKASRRRPLLGEGLEGTGQSIHLAHLLETEHSEPLVPPTRRIRTSCTCPDSDRGMVCKHVAAVAFVVADAIDADPALLLLWRGCEPVIPPAAWSGDPWVGGPMPPPRPPRALPPGAVVKRLGRSGIRVGNADLADALEPAYQAFAALSADPTVR